MTTSSRNGFGTKLLFHRSAAPGLFEATVWVMAFYIPLFPRSTWLIRPQGIKEETIPRGHSTTHYTEFLERRPTSWGRLLKMYCGVAAAMVAMWGPMIWGFVILDQHKGLNKTWVGGALVLIPIIWAVAMWVGLDLRRDRLYKQAIRQEGVGSRAYAGPIH